MMVYAQNIETGERGYQEVLSVSQTSVRKLFHIYLGDIEIQSTAMHQMYVHEKGFVTAQDLVVGDQLVYMEDGVQKQIPIDKITVQFYKIPVTVHNFKVNKWHTYMVGELGFLVHNGERTCGNSKISKSSIEGKEENKSSKVKEKNLALDLIGYYDMEQVLKDVKSGEIDLDTLKAGASLIPAAKITKVPKVLKAVGKVGETGFKKVKGVWKKFTRKDKLKSDKNKRKKSGSECDSKADLGNKLDYLFGGASGSKHNIERSRAMQAELRKIGIHNTSSGREYISNHLNDVLKDSSNISNVEIRSYIAKELPNKPVVEYTASTRESLLMGSGGAVKVESVWDDNRLLTVIVKGGK